MLSLIIIFVEPNNDFPTYPCGICHRLVGQTHRYIRCNICNYKVHIKCNETDEKTYEKMKNLDETMFCLKCNEELLPFFPSSNKNISIKTNETQSEHLQDSIKLFFKGINEFNGNQINNSEDNTPPLNCKYLDISTFNHKNTKNEFSLFHLNIASLAKHKEELDCTLSMLKYKFDVIGITETKIKKDITPINDISLKGYNIYHTPTESEKGGSLLYIADHLNVKPTQDLDLIHPNKKKSYVGVFIDIFLWTLI